MHRAFAVVFAAVSFAAPPEVLKVEPPNWWAGHSLNPVRLLIRGRNFQGARAVAGCGGGAVGLTRVNAAGTYLFVDVSIDAAARPGACPIRITTHEGAVEAPFAIVPRLTGGGQGLSPDDVIYLIMPDRFANGDPSNDDPPVSRGLFDRAKPRYYHGGDFQGIIDRLAYLRSLGVTALWLNPWYDNNNRLNPRETYNGEAIADYHGYGATDFYGVEEHFGDLAKLRELVEKAHAAGLKVIQDQVANHTGPYHPWVKDSPTPTWFNGAEASHLANTWQTWTLADPRATPEMQRATLSGWFINILPDLNQEDEETARYLIQNTLWWIGATGIDAIRQDTLPYVPRRFWRDWTAAIKRECPNCTVIGEMFDGDPALVSFFQGGRAQFDGVDSGIDTLFDFPLYYAIRHAFAEGKPIRELAVTLSHDRLYPRPELLVTFLGLHDVQRFMNVAGANADGLKLAFAFLMTARGTPLLYYGDEIAMRGGSDPDNRRDFPGGWPGDAPNAFEDSGRTAEQQAVWRHLAKLGKLRASREDLRRGAMVMLHADDAVLAYARGATLVVFNAAAKPAALDFSAGPLEFAGVITDALGSGVRARFENGRVRVEMGPRGAAIFPLPAAR